MAADLSVPPSEKAIQLEQGIGDDLIKVYPICTPLSRYFSGDKEDCVVRNMKALDQLTPEEIEAIPTRAKAFAVKLGLKQPIKMRFVTDSGTSLVKSNRARSQLHLGDREWWEKQGFQYEGQSLWNDTQKTVPRYWSK